MSVAYRLEDVAYRYPGTGRPALTIRALEIPDSRITALLGPNGAGKSTLLNLLGFLMPPGSGLLSYRGQPVPADRLREFRRRVGLVPQNPYLLHDTVAANVELGLKIRGTPARRRRALVHAVLEQLGLARLARRPARELSGGEAQKVAIARVLVMEPEVLLFDEPFTYLDRHVVQDFERLVQTIRDHRSQTIVFSTHDHLRAHALADRVVTLLDGRIAPTSLVNHFRGRLDRQAGVFETGHLRIAVPEGVANGEHIAVEANQIVLSTAPLNSSMRNHFEGRIVSLHEQNGLVNVHVQAGERFQVLITRAALRELGCHPGDSVTISFKSSAVQVF